MKKFTDWLIDERVVIAAIILNTVSLSILATYPIAANERWSSPWFLIDYSCVVYFVLEAIIKIRKHGWHGYWTNNWNKFDFLIVALSLPILADPLVGMVDFAGILVLRLGRLFRMFRLLRFIPNRDHMVEGIQRALKASVGVCLALVIINLILAIGATMLFGEIAPEYFGNPILSVYTTFKIFTVEGWYEVPDYLAQHSNNAAMGVLARGYFVMTVLIGGILGLSLANAVFVDQMTLDNNDALEDKVDRLHEEIIRLREQLLAHHPQAAARDEDPQPTPPTT